MSVIIFLMSISSMSHVDFKKYPRCPVDFKGQGPTIVCVEKGVPNVDQGNVIHTSFIHPFIHSFFILFFLELQFFHWYII